VGETQRFSADSILELLSANLGCGNRVILEATGPEADRALDAVAGLLVEPGERPSGRGNERPNEGPGLGGTLQEKSEAEKKRGVR
jgi:hypothetical protein